MKSTCLDCGSLILRNHNRCVLCRAKKEVERSKQIRRQMYRDPFYRAMVPTGQCYWKCGRVATTREHLVPLIEGGTNNPNNIVFACGECNFGRRGKNLSEEVK